MKFNYNNPKWRLFRDGLTEDEKQIIAEREAADKRFAEEERKVKQTVKTTGFRIIIDQMVAEMEYITRIELPNCKPNNLQIIQEKLRLYQSFLNKWNPYMN